MTAPLRGGEVFGPLPPPDGVRDQARELFGDALDAAATYAGWLAGPGIERGLLGPREGPRVWPRHLLNSAALARLVPPAAARLLDVGSGAGLPGLPIALARPHLAVTLLEPLARRAVFLEEVVAVLDLAPRVRVVRGRVEEGGATGREVGEAYPVVVARAVAPLERLVRWCLPRLAADGVLLAPKGASAAAEVTDAASTLQRLGVRAEVVPLPEADTVVVRLTREAPA